MTDLLCIEGLRQPADLQRLFEKGDIVPLAMDPWAMFALDKQGIAYRIPEDFYHLDELQLAYQQMHRAIERLCGLGDSFLASEVPAVKERPNLKPFRQAIYPLTVILDDMLAFLFELDRACAAVSAERIMMVRPRSAFSDDLVFDLKDNVHAGGLAELECPIPVTWLDPLRTDTIPESPAEAHGVRLGARAMIRKVALRNRTVFASLKALQRFSAKDLVQILRGNPVLLLSSAEYEWRFCRAMLRANGFRIMYTDFEQAGEAGFPAIDTSALLEALRLDVELRESLKIAGFDLFPLIAGKAVHIATKVAPQCVGAYEDMIGDCRAKRVKAILTTGLPSPVAHASIAAAHSLGLPIITWVHNGPIGHYEHLVGPHNDFEGSDLCLVGGVRGAATYEQRGQSLGCRIVPVGSASLDMISATSRGKRGVNCADRGTAKLLYAPTHFNRNCRYYAIKDLIFSDRFYLRAQLDLLEQLARLPDIERICKLHPSFEMVDPPWVHLAMGQDFKIIKNEMTFPELLAEADVIVLDSFYTTMMQTLATEKPLFLLLPKAPIFIEGAVDALKRRAACFFELPEMIAALEGWLAGGRYPADVSNRAFLRDFATFLDDGSSASRAVDYVLNIENFGAGRPLSGWSTGVRGS